MLLAIYVENTTEQSVCGSFALIIFITVLQLGSE